MPRVLAFSDLHVDYPENLSLVLSLSNSDFVQDTLIVAGDVSDSLERLKLCLESLAKKFRKLCFVPGNHELWVRDKATGDSIAKFAAILELCRSLEIATEPHKVAGTRQSLWLVPLFSWYRRPEEGEQTLYIEKITEDQSRFGWGDDSFCAWPEHLLNRCPADYFLQLNGARITAPYDAPVISFSHFLPRRELIFESAELARLFGDGCRAIEPYPGDPHPYFNFSRFAGDRAIDEQIRRLHSSLHIYGHQHRNRDRVIDGVRYISHCIGNIRERKLKTAADLQPKCVWAD